MRFTPHFFTSIRVLLQRIYRHGRNYKRAGVVLMGFVRDEEQGLFMPADDSPREGALLDMVDRFGGDIFWAREGSSGGVPLKQVRRSGRFTSRWGELVCV